MITNFEDFCIWVFVVVDDIWKPIAPFFKRLGAKLECGDSKLITMSGVILDFELTPANTTDIVHLYQSITREARIPSG